ncbi:MAG: SpoIIE family protein phosphatase [Chloroflexota bacterium]|nr:SpoIIE family protein phosphatase [Chloroflexota bacterium]
MKALDLDLEIYLAIAKIGKYATSESGDTVEVIERPHGGISAVIADGQRSGKAAKTISNIVVRKAVSLLADGVRDGAAARASHDYLRTHRRGQVSATLNIVSVDLASKTLLISRNSHCPVLVYNPAWAGKRSPDGWLFLNDPSDAIGIATLVKPVISEMALEVGTTVLVFTDGLWTAGERSGDRIAIAALVQSLIQKGVDDPEDLAEVVLEEAIRLDQGRPRDDMSLLVLGVRRREREDRVRRLSVSLPV